MKKRGIVRPQLYTDQHVYYSNRKGYLFATPIEEGIHDALRVTYESIPVIKTAGKENRDNDKADDMPKMRQTGGIHRRE